jgi:hypothetical protein
VRSQNAVSGVWRLDWQRRFFEWETLLLNDLMEKINSVSLSSEEDRWGWVPEGGADFTVNSTYRLVSNLSVPAFEAAQWFTPIFHSIWKCPAPSKVSGFVWQPAR